MNCDQAFDVMTSSRRDLDRGLQLHLDCCPRCREMRETLDPALHLFAPLDRPERDENWSHSPEATEIATRAARQLSQVSSTSAPASALASAPPQGTGLWSYAVAIVLGAGLVWCSIIRTPSSSAIPSIQRRETVCRFMSESRPRGVSGIEMTKTCLACHSVSPSKQ